MPQLFGISIVGLFDYPIHLFVRISENSWITPLHLLVEQAREALFLYETPVTDILNTPRAIDYEELFQAIENAELAQDVDVTEYEDNLDNEFADEQEDELENGLLEWAAEIGNFLDGVDDD